jgi:hypothetical protein
MLIIPCGLQFGCTFSPANFVPLADAREQLAESLSMDTELVHIHKEYLDLVQFSPDPDESVSFIQATSCVTHQGVFHTDGSRKNTKHNTFVDDNLMAETKKFMPQAMAASIEALFRLLGRPDIQYRKAALCLEKFVKATCSYNKTQLGKVINTRTMKVSMTKERIEKMTIQLDHWHSKRKSFTLKQGAQLLGLLEHASTYVVWEIFCFTL